MELYGRAKDSLAKEKVIAKRRLAEGPTYWKNLRRFLNYERKDNEDNKGELLIAIPGWSCGDIDRSGRLNLRSVFGLLENASSERALSFPMMAMGQVMHISKDLFTTAAVRRPMLMRLCQGYVGNSSFSTLKELIDLSCGVTLMTAERHMASVDFKTGRSTYLPDDVKAAMIQQATKDKSRVPTPPPRPDNSSVNALYTYSLKVRHSDLDGLFHVNQANYISFCLDCAADASLAGFYPALRGDICWYTIKYVSVTYLGQALAGDELTVYTWGGEAHRVYFEVEKEGRVISKCIIEFFDQLDHSKL